MPTRLGAAPRKPCIRPISALPIPSGGKEYATDIQHFGRTLGSGDSSEAELRKLRYPVGKKVTAAYKPNDPAIAAAEAGFDHEALFLIGGALFFIMPATMLIVTWFGMTRDNSAFAIGLDMFVGIFAAIADDREIEPPHVLAYRRDDGCRIRRPPARCQAPRAAVQCGC